MDRIESLGAIKLSKSQNKWRVKTSGLQVHLFTNRRLFNACNGYIHTYIQTIWKIYL